MEKVSSVAGRVGNWVFDAISLRQLCYLLSYNYNIQTLRKKSDDLEHLKNTIQGKIGAAKGNEEVIEADVEKWVARVGKINEEAKKLLDDEVKTNKRCLNGWCFNLGLRYKFSQEAKEKAEAISRLHEEGNFQRVSHTPTRPPPPPPPPLPRKCSHCNKLM